MATTKLSATKSTSRAINYAEKLAPNHQVAVYTHADTDHVHNHIVINAINLETGKKFNNNKQALRDVRDFNDVVCREHGLSVPEKDTARLRYTQTEKAIADPNTQSTVQYSWKDEIREAIDQSQATNMDEFKDHLNQHGITIERVTPKSITYRHLAEDKKVRGRKLGEDYNKGGIEDGFERQIQRQQQTERASDTDVQPKRRTSSRDEETERDTGVTQSDWDKFAQDTNELERSRQAAESARLVDEKARRDREERARAKQASQRIINDDRDHGLEL